MLIKNMLKVCKLINNNVELNTKLSDLYTESTFVGRNRRDLMDLNTLDKETYTRYKECRP